MTTYLNIGGGGADTWADAVDTSASLPATGAAGQVKLVKDTGIVVYWDGAAWASIGASSSGSTIAALAAIIDGSSATAGQINEILTASQVAVTTTGVGATGVYGNAISLSITAGRWVVTGVAGFDDNGAVLTTGFEGGISSSTTGVGLTAVDIVKDDSISGSATINRSLVVPQTQISISGTTTYYINTKFTYSSGTPRHFGKITARRIG